MESDICWSGLGAGLDLDEFEIEEFGGRADVGCAMSDS
jgi:hypothetical protein